MFYLHCHSNVFMALCIDAPLRLRPGLLSLLTLFQVPLVEPVVTAQLQAVSAPANGSP